jgi:hypothetical protein
MASEKVSTSSNSNQSLEISPKVSRQLGEEQEKRTTNLVAEPAASPKEDVFAWVQVLAAFFLNLNTWLVNFSMVSGKGWV